MADSKISALSAITAIASTDELAVASAGASKKITGANLGASIALTTVDAVLGGDVTIVSSNTFVDGPSGSFVAGVWLIVWKLQLVPIVTTSQQYFWTAKLWDGTTVYDEAEISFGGYASANQNGWPTQLKGQALITLGSTTTLKVSAAEGHGSSSSKIARDVPDNSATSHKATRLTGVKIG